jgi:quercetin dioxygenase-like cupin family protein
LPIRWCYRKVARLPTSTIGEDEAFWVLEGELEVLVDENRFKAVAGSFVHLPKGVLHSYENVGTGPARFLTLMVPAGLERVLRK